jgi:hypothetical protein
MDDQQDGAQHELALSLGPGVVGKAAHSWREHNVVIMAADPDRSTPIWPAARWLPTLRRPPGPWSYAAVSSPHARGSSGLTAVEPGRRYVVPHARGSFCGDQRQGGHQHVVPARAGIIRQAASDRGDRGRCSRTRGDHPSSSI